MAVIAEQRSDCNVREIIKGVDRRLYYKREKNYMPQTYCYWCNRINVGTKYRNPHRYLFWKSGTCGCNHEPRVPNPTFVSESDFHEKQESENIIREVLLGEENRGSARTRARRTFRNKIAASLPKISENSTSLVYRKTNSYRSLDSEHPDKIRDPLLARLPSDKTQQPTGVNRQDDANASELRERLSHGGLVYDSFGYNRRVPNNSAHESLAPETPIDNKNIGHVKYHHREPEEKIQKFSVRIKKRRSSREPSFEIHRSLSTISRASEGSSRYGDSPLRITNLKSGSWCQCPDMNISSYQCYDCRQLGGTHSVSCTFYRSPSTIGKCGTCGNLIQKCRDISRESTSLSSSCVRQYTSSSIRESVKNLKHNGGKSMGSIKSEDADGYIKKINVKFAAGSYDFDTDLDVNKIETGLKLTRDVTPNNVPLVNTKTPDIVDPNIHRDAYLRALKDSRYKKFKTSKSLDYHDRTAQPFVFSYYDVLPWVPSNVKLSNNVGIREYEKPSKKKGMRHIFGKVKVEDYYPNGKMYKSLPVLPKIETDKEVATTQR